MKKKSGFTLVELLAVILILGLIMIIAIPTVLQAMYIARKNTFSTYLNRISNETQKQYTHDSMYGEINGTKIYNIVKELGLSNTGDFKGYSLISPTTNSVYITLYNKEHAFVATKYNDKNAKKEIKLLKDVNPDHLTPEYLCSVVEECTECSYIVIDESGNESINIITPEKHEYDALLKTGDEWRETMKSLVALENITEIKYSETIPEDVTKKELQSDNSKLPVYMWNVGNIIYYSSEGRNIFLNSNSNNMFSQLTNCTHIDTTKLRFDEVTEAKSIFYKDIALVSLDTSDWNLKNVQYLDQAFAGDKALTSIDTKNWNMQNIKSLSSTFNGCANLSGTIDMSGWSFTSLSNISYTFSEDRKLEYVILPNTKSSLTQMSGTWNYCEKLKHITNLENLDVSQVRAFNLTFKYCSELDEINMSKWNMPNLNQIDWTFQQCLKIKELDFSGFDFSKVPSFNGIFYGDKALQKVTFVNKDFSSAKQMTNVFVASGIREIDLSGAKMPNVTSLKTFFQNASYMKKANLSNIKATSLTTMEQMFMGCASLEELNLDGFEAPKIENMHMTFYLNKLLKTLNLSGFNDQTLTNITNTFNSCTELTTIYVSKEWNLSDSASEGTGTFWKCSKLKGGITYDSNKTSGLYAKVNNGYFTLKG